MFDLLKNNWHFELTSEQTIHWLEHIHCTNSLLKIYLDCIKYLEKSVLIDPNIIANSKLNNYRVSCRTQIFFLPNALHHPTGATKFGCDNSWKILLQCKYLIRTTRVYSLQSKIPMISIYSSRSYQKNSDLLNRIRFLTQIRTSGFVC